MDFWQSRFKPVAPHNAGGGIAMYRQCAKCGGRALEGSLSAHARWCGKQEKAPELPKRAA